MSLTDARGYRAEMRYDGFGRQQRWIFPSKTSPGVADQSDYEQYLYDPNGNRVSLRKRDGRVIGYGYDPLNRVTLKLLPAPHDSVRYAYDLRGLQTGAAFASTGWGVSNAYDGFGRLISTASNMGGFSRTVSHKYDSDGRESEIAFPDGQKFWTRRDGLGRATEAYQGPLGSTSTIMIAFAYNAASQLSYFARRFGDWTAYGYDGPGRLSSLEDGFGAGLGNTRSDFLYNPASQLRSETRTNDSYAWRGSAAVSRDYATNGQNQYSSTSSGATFAYDPNGNLTSTVNAPWSTSYVYDPENRLISASGTENASLIYDPLGRLFQISSPATGVTQFLYDGDELAAEYNGSGTMLRRYVHGDSDDDPLFWYEGAGFDQPRFPHTDRQGSVAGTAGPGAALLGINTYDEYGIRGADNAGRFQYTGQAWLPELGLYYYKARLYSPSLGRFLQVDPIGYDGGISLYAYVENDPLNRSDPTGLSPTDDPTTFEAAQGRGFHPPPTPGWLEALIDFTPVVGDIKAGYEAYQNPTAVNILIAAIGVVPGAGDLAGKVIRSLEKGARTLEKRALQHEAKAAREAANPTVRPGMEGRSPREIASQQKVRQNHLKTEAAEYRRQAAEKRKLADKLRKELK